MLDSGDTDKIIPFDKGQDRFISNKISSGFSGSTFVIDGVQNKLYPGWKGYAEKANAASEDAIKLVTGSKEFNDYLEKYKDLPEAGEYKKDLAAYQQVIPLAIPGLIIERSQMYKWQLCCGGLPPA